MSWIRAGLQVNFKPPTERARKWLPLHVAEKNSFPSGALLGPMVPPPSNPGPSLSVTVVCALSSRQAGSVAMLCFSLGEVHLQSQAGRGYKSL